MTQTLQKFSYNHDSIMNTIKSYLTPNLWMILQRWINLTMRVHIQNVSQKVDAFHWYRKNVKRLMKTLFY